MVDVAGVVHDVVGREAVVGIHLHSAPRRGSPEALERSLGELCASSRMPPALVLEHVDAERPDGTAAKGFLTLAAEIAVIQGAGLPVSVGVNWARSAIELRDPDRVTEHIRYARESGLLGSLFFSGVSDRATSYGGAWSDAHLPIAGSIGVGGEPASLLTPERVQAALAVAGQVPIVGVKFAYRKPDGDRPSTAASGLMLHRAARIVSGRRDVLPVTSPG
jgi:Domain of unknown function (DUF4862)